MKTHTEADHYHLMPLHVKCAIIECLYWYWISVLILIILIIQKKVVIGHNEYIDTHNAAHLLLLSHPSLIQLALPCDQAIDDICHIII